MYIVFTVKVANMEIVYEDHKTYSVLGFKIYGKSPSQTAPKFGPEGGSQLHEFTS